MLVYGGALLVVVVIIYFVMSGGSGDTKQNTETPAPATNQVTPAPTPTPAPTGSTKTGKTPATPAPELKPETLSKVRDMIASAKALYNEASTARTAGDNRLAREKASAAKVIVDDIKALVEAAADWQMQAEMEGWTQSGDYVDLGKVDGEVMNLSNLIRKNGGQ